MSINIDIPERKIMIPKIAVLGVGGAGGNAVDNMINLKLQGVNFIVANTDSQALASSNADLKLQLGENITKGLGAGSSPKVGEEAAEESRDEVLSHLADNNMVFITAGMGGGTGTGAAPIISRVCKENNILTVGVVTKPFHFEGSHRMKTAEAGVLEMQKYVDTLIVIPNQNLFHKATEKTTFAEAFDMVDQVLYSGIKGITDLMTMPGLINLDFADIRTIMGGMGKAVMGTGEAAGDKRALDAAESAISNPLLDHTSMKGAKGVLINISGGLDMTLFEADEAAQRVKDEVDPDANIIFGSTFDKELDGKIRVSVVATGIDIAKKDAKPAIIEYEEKKVENKITQVSDTNPNSETRISANDIEQSFIPPEAVEPQSFSKTEAENSQNISTASEQPNVISLQDQMRQEEINYLNIQNQLTSQPTQEAKKVVGEEHIASVPNVAVNNIQPQHHNTQPQDSTPQNIHNPSHVNFQPQNNASGTKTKSRKLGGLFSFFKDLQNGDGKDTSNQHGQDNLEQNSNNNYKNNDLNESVNADLTLSDDILNVPTFIRNKNDQS